MLSLLLFRHAKADSPAALTDHERPLSIVGQKQARHMGRLIQTQSLEPDHTVISSARRTRETWAEARDTGNLHCTTSAEPRIYEASVEDLLDVISKQSPAHRRLMLIGHNPGMERLTTWLTGSGDADALANRQKKGFTVGSLAVITLPSESWSTLEAHSGRLELFLNPDTPAAVDGLTDASG